MTVPLSQIVRSFLTMDCADWFIWRIVGEPVRSELDSPIAPPITADVKFAANLVIESIHGWR